MKKFAKLLSATLLVVMTVLVMTACVPKNAEKAQEKLEDKGYKVMVMNLNEPEFAGHDAKGATFQIYAVKGDEELGDVDMVVAIWFEKKAQAKAYYEDHVDELEEPDEGVFAKLKGKVVYWGTNQGVKDFE